VGKNQIGFDIYIGRGTYGGQEASGNIQPGGTAGFYIANSGLERYMANNASYLVVPKTCTCNWIPNAVSTTSPGVIIVGKSRITIFTFPKCARTIGKHWYSDASMYYADGGKEVGTTSFHVLQCIA
jgi:hypothetical protein